MKTYTVAICRLRGTLAGTKAIMDKTFQIADIRQFHAYNDSYTKTDGSFRRFKLQGTIQLRDGNSYHIGTFDTTELKKLLKPLAVEVIKTPVIQQKKVWNGYAERKAVNWIYTF